MAKRIEFNSNHYYFLLKAAACFAGLLVGGFILAPPVSTQNSNKPVVVNNSMRGMSNYQPTPEPPRTTLRGRVFYADTGKAVKRASLMLIAEDVSGGPGNSPSALSDSEGNFLMKGVQAGTYYAIINAPGVYTPLAFYDFSVAGSRGSEKEAFKKAFDGFEKIYVDGVTETFVQIPARRGGAIGGRVIYDDGDAAVGVKVEVLRKVEEDKFMPSIPNLSTILSMRSGGGVFQTDDRGAYRFAGLPPGDYIVKVSENVSHVENTEKRYYDPFQGSISGKSFLTIFYPDAADSKSAQLITLASGQEITEINLTLPSRELFQVEGKIVARKDKSPVKARISINKTNQDDVFSIFDDFGGRQQQAVTDEKGDWKFKELPKGKYTLTIEPVSDEPDYNSYQEYSNTNSVNRPATNTPPKPKLAKRTYELTIEDKDLSEIVVEMGFGATVSGTVTTENSREMPASINISTVQEASQITSSATVYNSSDNESREPQKTDHDFKVEGIAEGKTEFRISASDDSFYVKSATLNGTDLLANTIELKEGDNLRNVQIVLSKGVGTFKGAVQDEAKSPVKRAEFMLVPVDAAKWKNFGFHRRVTADENGEFETKLPPREYAIIFAGKDKFALKGEEFNRWLDAAMKEARKITIRTNETEKIILSLPK